MSENLTWADVLAACQQYNIPPTAKIELATGWECSPTGSTHLFYSISKNTLAIVDDIEYWYEKGDWILIKKIK